MKYGFEELQIKFNVDIRVAVVLGFSEGSFPYYINAISNSSIKVVEGRENGDIIIVLARMTDEEAQKIRISPTWRTDDIK